MHVASPVARRAPTDPQKELVLKSLNAFLVTNYCKVDPAVKGTLNVLNACRVHHSYTER